VLCFQDLRPFRPMTSFSWHLQLRNALDKLREQVQRFSSVVDAAEDQVFGSFCRDIGVANVREYEARQLKLAEEESEARLRFETQIARLTHLYEMTLARWTTDLILLEDLSLRRSN